jgi:hypothetical protein
MLRIAIIIGSTRPGRKGEAVARWVYEIAQKRSDAEFELVDIKDFDLPLLDEPMSPTMGQYSKPHTKVWAAKIGSFDGYVFVTPEYKAAGFVSYGGAAGGARGRAATPGAGGGADGDGAQPSLALHVYRLRELQRLQAGCPSREVCQCNVRPSHRLGRRVENVAREMSVGRYGVNRGVQTDSNDKRNDYIIQQ